MSSSSRPKVEWFGFVNDSFLHLNRTMTALCPSVLNREPACTLYPLLCNNTGFLLAICCPAPDLAAAWPAHALPSPYAKRAGAGRCGGMHLQGSSEGPPRHRWYHPWLFAVIQSGFQSFSMFQDGAIQILEVSGCFMTAGSVFQDRLSVVQDGSGRLSGRIRMAVWFQYNFSLAFQCGLSLVF